METYEPVWKKVEGSEAVPMFGFPFDVGVEPIAVNVERMIKAYSQGVKDLRDIYAGFLSAETRAELAACTQETGDAFRFPDKLWVHVIYEFAVAHRKRAMDRGHLMQSLVPLYMGRTASFVIEMRDAMPAEVEQRIDQLAGVFEAEKSYLMARWGGSPGKEQSHA